MGDLEAYYGRFQTMNQAMMEAQAKSISKWTFPRKKYIAAQRRLGKPVSPVKARPITENKEDILELLFLRKKRTENTITPQDVERFHEKYIRSKMTRMAKRQTLRNLLSDPLTAYDLAMALEVSMEDTIEALAELEDLGRTQLAADGMTIELI